MMQQPATNYRECQKMLSLYKMFWYFLHGLVNILYPFMVLLKQPMGCQFINIHNKTVTEVFNFNTNIQIGDASQVFYSTLYTSKSMQEEDSKHTN